MAPQLVVYKHCIDDDRKIGSPRRCYMIEHSIVAKHEFSNILIYYTELCCAASSWLAR